MSEFPDLPTAMANAARLEAEYIVDAAAYGLEYARALNALAIAQGAEVPDAAVASFVRAVEVLGHLDDAPVDDLSCALFNALTVLLAGGHAEQALELAERAIEIERGPHGAASGLGIAYDQKAEALRQLGRHAEELEFRLEALGQFALAEGEETGVRRSAEILTTHAAKRAGELLQE